MSRAEAMRAHPDFPWLSADRPEEVAEFVAARGWLESEETVRSCEKAGEGNMNLTLRLRTSSRTLILKQARPWVEKYDTIAAPWDRAIFEQRFYQRAATISPVATRMPRLLAADREARVLLLEDVAGRDFSHLYFGAVIEPTELAELAIYLASLHGATRGQAGKEFANREMRALNHAHIFDIPLTQQETAHLDRFEPGLGQAAAKLSRDGKYIAEIKATGERYLADGPYLVHGDYFPGSWLRTPRGVRVIDPEFCFCGDAEFDLGVAIAHFALARQPQKVAGSLVTGYRSVAESPEIDTHWIARYAAAEIMRRLIGVAQLPIPESDGFRADLLARSKTMMFQRSWEVLWA